MKRIGVIVLALGLASCYSLTEEDNLRIGAQAVPSRAVLIRPVSQLPSNPTVVSSKGILAYHQDLRSCRAVASSTLGTDGATDDVGALQRTLQDKTLNGSVSVRYEFDDGAMKRDKIVKQCLSKRGYVVRG